MRSALFNSLPDALLVVEAGGNILLANDAAVRLFGYARAELVGSPVELLIPAALRGAHRRHRSDYERDPRARAMGDVEMKLVGQARDGRQFPVEIALKPLRIGARTRMMASVRDVSETHLARRVLRRSGYDAASLRIGQIANGVPRGNEIEQIVHVVGETLGLGPVALLEHTESAAPLRLRAGVSFLHDDWLARNAVALLGLVAEGARILVPDDLPDGLEMPPGMLSGLAAPVGDGGAAPTGVLLAFSRLGGRYDNDATHFLDTAASLLSAMSQRRLAEEQLAHAQRLDAVGRLTSGVAHDFNNLLTVVSGNLQLLDENVAGDPGSHELIDMALRAVDRGAALTRKLLSFAGRQHLRPQPVDLNKLVADLRRLMLATLGDRIALSVSDSQALPLAYVDPALLDSALLNLVLNARDAIQGAGSVVITLGADPRGTSRGAPDGVQLVSISVEDSGSGMSQEVLDRVFEPFFTTKTDGRGTGLGLSMVYGFARQSGGDVRVVSHIGVGTRVTLLLPVATDADCYDLVEAAMPVRGGSEVVLVVEDDGAVRATVAASLRALGYGVLEAATAEAALSQLWATPTVALLFSDVSLEGSMTGDELARAARHTHPDLKVLLTSGYEDAIPGHAAGQFAILPKPYRREELAAAVRHELDGVPAAS